MKEKLQSVTDYKVMSFKECVKSLGWSLEENEEYYQITCDCSNSHIVYSGFIGTEVIRCENCGKEMTDLFSPIRAGNATCSILNPSDYEFEVDEDGNGRYWIGNIMKESEE